MPERARAAQQVQAVPARGVRELEVKSPQYVYDRWCVLHLADGGLRREMMAELTEFARAAVMNQV